MQRSSSHDLPVLFIDNDGVLTDAHRMGPEYGRRFGELMVARFGGAVEEWAEANAVGFEAMMEWYHANSGRYDSGECYFDDLYRVNLETSFRHMGHEPLPWDPEGRRLNRRLLFECPAGVDTLFPGAREAVEELASRGYRLNMASNAHSLHCEGTLAGAGIRQHFVHAFGPDLVGLPVKSVEFYRRMCEYVCLTVRSDFFSLAWRYSKKSTMSLGPTSRMSGNLSSKCLRIFRM